MGSDRDKEEGPIHQVHVPSFALGMYPVTQQQWEAVMGHNPSFFKGANRPVESITWFDAQAFIAKLNEQTGQTYRLPSEDPFGLYDMLGNVREWCQDIGGNHYCDAPTDGSARINTSSDEGDIRIFRGGCWSEKATVLSSTRRYTVHSSYHKITLGLRLAMTLK
jgi:formylglycine-generating enzyme required for sulfatase activity